MSVEQAANASTERRLSVCYVVPGHGLLTSAGPTRNVLNVARALAEWCDVSVAFRSVLDPCVPESPKVLELDPGHGPRRSPADDAALRDVGYVEFLRYLRALQRFVSTHAAGFDVVLEKAWLLSGYVCRLCRRAGVPAIAVENLVSRAPSAGSGPMKRARNRVGTYLAARYLRGAPLVIAETEPLRQDLVERCGLSPNRVEVVPLGVDRDHFRPQDGGDARRALGISPDSDVLVYVGVLDRTHDLLPVLEALARAAPPSVELHVVGDGPLRSVYEAVAARGGARVTFHGRVLPDAVPTYIAAADLCLAPYDRRAFQGGTVAYSTLKVPEYLSCGRAVASVPSGRIAELVRDGVSGFLFPNEADRWVAFLRDYPHRETLRRMGRAAAETPLETWTDTARGYYEACRSVLQEAERARRGA